MPRRGPRIFVSIAAYCDPLLGFTLRSAWSQAAHPERLSFGVVEQTLPTHPLRSRAQWTRAIRWTRVHATEARGPCWARALAMALYQGEEWFLQVDSHTWFEPGWDQVLVDWGERCRELNPRCILSCYPNPFVLRDGQPRATVVSPRVLAHVVSDHSDFAAEHPVLMFEGVPVDTRDPVPGLHLAAGCLFAPGSIVHELPYDPALFFHGEEQAYALRAWTRGWDIYHVPGMPLYHLYTAPGEAPRPLHWTPAHDAERHETSAELTARAERRLRALLWEDADLGVYGLGTVRSLADYAAFSGVDYAARRIESRARKARFGYGVDAVPTASLDARRA